jgi:hypothetical protein
VTVLRDVNRLSATLVHQTGSMIRFTTSQLSNLPPTKLPCEVVLPDGQIVGGLLHPHPQNPYLAGREVVRWIKSWLAFGETIPISVLQVGNRDRVRVELLGPAHVGSSSITRAVRALAKETAPRRRVRYETWERNPSLRGFVLSIWDASCQVLGCDMGAAMGVPAHLAGRLVDVHHLNHVGSGGTDSPLNLAVLCVMHHNLIHRAPTTGLVESDFVRAVVRVNGDELEVRRDVRALMAALEG